MEFKYFEGASDDFKAKFGAVFKEDEVDKANTILSLIGTVIADGKSASDKAMQDYKDNQAKEAAAAKEKAEKEAADANAKAFAEFKEFVNSGEKENIKRLFNNIEDPDKLIEEINKAGFGTSLAAAKFLAETGKKFEFNNGTKTPPASSPVGKSLYGKMADDFSK